MKLVSYLGLLIFVLLLSEDLFGQVKFEREYRIKEKQVPENALNFTNLTLPGVKVKWYAEESHDGKTLEAKTKFRGYKFSIEFDSAGMLLDVEKTIEFDSLTFLIKQQITDLLIEKFGTYKVLKTQVQWVAPEPVLSELIVSGGSSKTFEQKYELVIETRTEHHFAAFELLFSDSGGLEKMLEIDLRNMNNMEF
ncbi:MAG: hypothetical protein IH598_05950 [Bacteroidales bacterium]|nr:hypothetical protein [Bacteroidales bacterium]